MYALTWLVGLLACSETSPPEPTEPSWLMAVHACEVDVSCHHTDHRTWLLASPDGERFAPLPGFAPHRGSVPDVVQRDDTVYVYNPGSVRRWDRAADTWSEVLPVELARADGTAEAFVDPTLAVDDQGRLVLFYLPDAAEPGMDPSRCPVTEAQCDLVIRSATEVSGSHGTRFVIDEGERLTVQVPGKRRASDPDLVRGPNGWNLLMVVMGKLTLYESSSLRGAYATVDTLPRGFVGQRLGSVPSAVYSDGSWRTFTHSAEPNRPSTVTAFTGDLLQGLKRRDGVTVLRGGDLPDGGETTAVGAPSVARLR